jgi:hypothetical protein
MAKGSKTTTGTTQTLDPEIQRRLYGITDQVNRWTGGVLDDGGTTSSSYTPPVGGGGGFNWGGGGGWGGDIPGGGGNFDWSGYGGTPMSQDLDAGGDTPGWTAPTTFTADHTDMTQQFLDATRNPLITGQDFTTLADKFQETPTFDWTTGTSAEADIGDFAQMGPTGIGDFQQMSPTALAAYGDAPVITAGRGLDYMGDYGSGYTNEVIDKSMAAMQRRFDKNMLQSQIAQTASGAGTGSMRQGIADSEVRLQHLIDSGQLESQLRDTGFTRALEAGMRDVDRKLSADTSTGQISAERLANMFAAENARNMFDAGNEFTRRGDIFGAQTARDQFDAANEFARRGDVFSAGNIAAENNAARRQAQTMADQRGIYDASRDTEAARMAGLTGAERVLGTGGRMDLSNIAMMGTGAGIDQSLADRRAAEPLEMLKLRMASVGLLPNLTNTDTVSSVKPGLFDWVGLGASALS